MCLPILPPVVSALLQAGHAQRDHGLLAESPCWILPNGWVSRPPGSTTCPLDTLDRVHAVIAADGARSPVQDPAATKLALARAAPGALHNAPHHPPPPWGGGGGVGGGGGGPGGGGGGVDSVLNLIGDRPAFLRRQITIPHHRWIRIPL